MDKQITELYFQDYANTEFVQEPEIKEYLSRIHDFLDTYFNRYEPSVWTCQEDFDTDGFLILWQKYIVEAVYEIYNSFLYGNFMSAMAMSRALMESCVYYAILKEEKSSELIFEWFISNLMNRVRRMEPKYREKMRTAVEMFCEEKDRDCDKLWDRYMKSKLYESEWLKDIIAPDKPTFYNCCKYIGEETLYDDFHYASGFVHAQSITNKMCPFAFYENIYAKLQLVMIYIFKSLRLFNTREDAELEMCSLEIRLAELCDFWETE